MKGENVEFSTATERSITDGKRINQRSTIEFPYGNLQDAIEIANAIHSQYGIECETDQLAAAMLQSSKSGSFRVKVSSARMFGATENERGRVKLTNFGRHLADPIVRRRASVEGFLNVELYKQIYDKFKGTTLPPARALERVMVEMGVAAKQAPKARQVFDKSAEQAGFFEGGKDRLVKPGNLGPEYDGSSIQEDTITDDKGGSGSGGGGDDNLDQYDPFIQGLLKRLPNSDSEWSMKDRANWLIAAEQIFKLIYKEKSGDQSVLEVRLVGETPVVDLFPK